MPGDDLRELGAGRGDESCDLDAEVGVRDGLAGDDLVDHRADGVRRDREPDASLPPDWLWIWALTPITWPAASSSGPPELPWLIGASVWIESLIEKLFGESIVRWSALTMPLVTVWASPNGLPIATTGSPTWTASELPNVSGVEQRRRAPRCARRRGRSSCRCRRRAPAKVLPFQSLTVICVAPATT